MRWELDWNFEKSLRNFLLFLASFWEFLRKIFLQRLIFLVFSFSNKIEEFLIFETVPTGSLIQWALIQTAPTKFVSSLQWALIQVSGFLIIVEIILFEFTELSITATRAAQNFPFSICLFFLNFSKMLKSSFTAPTKFEETNPVGFGFL